MSHWYYRTQIGDAGLNRKPPRLKDLGEHSIRIFVREVIQNNLDATEEGKNVTVDINIHEWKRKDIESFFDFIGEDHIEHLRKSCADPDPSVVPYLRDSVEIINGKKTSSFLVVVEESNCIGLLGPVRESKTEKSHFDALMRKVENNEAKKETTNTGGTWGKGSSIFTYTSALWTWFSYSRLSKPWYDPTKKVEHKTRFIGRCMLAPFFNEPKNESFLGDGWFCESLDAFPFINSQADDYARKLGLKVRENNSGTTFFIPFFKAEVEDSDENIDVEILQREFITQVLQNWFIPIFKETLIVNISIKDETTRISKDFLKTIPELKFKLQLLNWYENGCPPEDKRFIKESIELEVPALKEDYLNTRTQFARTRQKAKADLILRLLDEDEDFNNKWNTVNRVALCRNKGMIINDEALFENQTLRTESILLSGLLTKSELNEDKKKHLDLFLGYAENPAHNTWCRTANDYDRCFLDRFEGKRPKPEASINHLFNEVYRVFKKLLEEGNEPQENKDICTIFKKLARLRSRGGDVVGKPLFHMRSISDDIDSEGRYIFTKRIISNTSENDLEIHFKSYIDSLEGEKDKDFEHLGIKDFSNLEIIDLEGKIIGEGREPSLLLPPMQESVIKIRTCKIDKNPFFKNVDPFIKATAKVLTNE